MQTPSIPADSLLVTDFEHFLRYLDRKPRLSLTAAGDLKSADLWAINQGVNYKAPDYVTTKSRVADYPLLAFLFQVVTASRLYVLAHDKTPVLVADTARLSTYLALTQEEKYVFLLETAWCYVDWGTLDGDGRSGHGANWLGAGLTKLLNFSVGTSVELSDTWAHRDRERTIPSSGASNAYTRAGYWFGWYDIDEVIKAKRDKYSLDIGRVTLTEWGKQCLPLLLQERPFRHWNKHATFCFFFDETGAADVPDQEAIDINTFADLFRTLFAEPDLLSLYPINSNPPTGTYLIRAELPAHKVSRTIAMPATHTLDELHGMIQLTFGFDDDHLYGFYLNPRNPYNGEQYFDPRAEESWAEGYPADAITLSSLNLYEGQRFLYKFDFGARWDFTITVMRHLPDDEAETAVLVEQIGTSPEQYNYDDEE